MSARLPAALVWLALTTTGALAAPVPAGGAGRPPTAEEFAAAARAYQAVGGAAYRPVDPAGRVPCEFILLAVTAETVARLPDPPFDYRLTLRISPDTPRGALGSLARLRHLRSVAVGLGRDNAGRELAEGWAADRVAELAAVPNLQELVLDGGDRVPLTDELAGRLGGFAALRVLAAGGPVTDAGLKDLAGHPALERLSLRGCPAVTDDGLLHLAGMRALRVLDLRDCPKSTAAGLRPFAVDPKLTALSIGGDGMTDAALAEVGRIATLEAVDLSDLRHPVTADGLGGLARLPRLRSLVLPKRLEGTDAVLAALAPAACVERVRLADAAAVTDAGLGHLGRMAGLREVDLSLAGRVTDGGLKALAGLPRLETVYLDGAKGVTDAGVANLLGSATLTGLSVGGSRVTEAGVRAVVADRGKRLRLLGARGVGVGDEFVAELAAAAPGLVHLDLTGNRGVTDTSLGRLAGLPGLRSVCLLGTGVTRKGADGLRARRPDLWVGAPYRPE